MRWVTRIAPGVPAAPAGRFGGFGNAGPEMPRTISGFGTGALNQSTGRPARIVSSALAVDGKLYVSTLDNAWAIDARDGRLLWHYVWKTLGGTHTGNRGIGMWKQWLYMTTPDNYLICLDSRTGKERWTKKIAELDAAVLHDHGADRHRRLRARQPGQRPRRTRLHEGLRRRHR